MERDDGIFRAVIERLDLASPRLTVSGDMLLKTSASSFQLKMRGRNLDVGEIREAALRLVGDAKPVQNLFHLRPRGSDSGDQL